MSLGITDAAHIFTALTDPLMGYVRTRGARSVIYIDDLLSLSRSVTFGLQQDTFIQNVFLKGSGFSNLLNPPVPPLKKCCFWVSLLTQ